MPPARKEPDPSTYSGRCAARLRMLREKAGLTVGEVAAACGVTTKRMYNWESGLHDPRLDAIPKLAKAYGLKNTRSVFAEK